MFDKPRVLIIHDIINESEIEEVLSLASGRLRRATARNARTGQFEPADYRIRLGRRKFGLRGHHANASH